MNAEQRDQRISEVFDAMEAGEATMDDYWDAVFPTLEWCEYELKQLGFHSNYDQLYEIVQAANVNSESPEIPDEALAYREITPETDLLENDERAIVITALRYRKAYLNTGKNQMKPLIRLKDKGILSAESVVTVRVGVTYHLKDEPDPTFFQVMITAPATDLELFLLPFTDDDNAELEVEILNIIQPYIGKHVENLKWVDYIVQRHNEKVQQE